jgi:hypothetical protein
MVLKHFFGLVFIWKSLLLVSYSVFKCVFMLHKGIFIEETLNMFLKWLVSMLTLKLSTSITGRPSLTPCDLRHPICYIGRLAEV